MEPDAVYLKTHGGAPFRVLLGHEPRVGDWVESSDGETYAVSRRVLRDDFETMLCHVTVVDRRYVS